MPRLADIDDRLAGIGTAASASYAGRLIASALKVRVAGNPAMNGLYLAGSKTWPSLDDEAGDGTGADPEP